MKKTINQLFEEIFGTPYAESKTKRETKTVFSMDKYFSAWEKTGRTEFITDAIRNPNHWSWSAAGLTKEEMNKLNLLTNPDWMEEVYVDYGEPVTPFVFDPRPYILEAFGVKPNDDKKTEEDDFILTLIEGAIRFLDSLIETTPETPTPEPEPETPTDEDEDFFLEIGKAMAADMLKQIKTHSVPDNNANFTAKIGDVVYIKKDSGYDGMEGSIGAVVARYYCPESGAMYLVRLTNHKSQLSEDGSFPFMDGDFEVLN